MSDKLINKKEKICPLLKKPCIKDQCMFWREFLSSDDPNPNTVVSSWDCSLGRIANAQPLEVKDRS